MDIDLLYALRSALATYIILMFGVLVIIITCEVLWGRRDDE